MFFTTQSKTSSLVTKQHALPGRSDTLNTASHHAVFGNILKLSVPENCAELIVAMGCFWGAERIFWTQKGVLSTAVGYAGGFTPNPTYEEVCSGQTGHTECVRIVFDPSIISLEHLLKAFWEGHDPTQGMRQGNDVGSQYRSAVYWTNDAQGQTVTASKAAYNDALKAKNCGAITTEIGLLDHFYYAEAYHQQYLHKNPFGYCGLGGTGVTCPVEIDDPSV